MFKSPFLGEVSVILYMLQNSQLFSEIKSNQILKLGTT